MTIIGALMVAALPLLGAPVAAVELPGPPDASGNSAYCNANFFQEFPNEPKRMQAYVDCNYGPAAEPITTFAVTISEWRPSNPPNYRTRWEPMVSQGQPVSAGTTILENANGRFRAVKTDINMAWEVPWSWWHVDAANSCGTTSAPLNPAGNYSSGQFSTASGQRFWNYAGQCSHSPGPPPQPLDWFPGGSGPRYVTAAELAGAGSPSINLCDCKADVAQPVNTGTGNFWHSFEDFAIPGRGSPLQLTRTYNAQNASEDGPLGHGWTHSYEVSLTVGANDVVVNEEPGSKLTFSGTGPTYIAPPRVRATLVREADGTYTFTRRQRQVFAFDAAGRLTSQRDLNGETTNLTYPDAATMVVTNPAGRSLTFTSTGGRVTQVADSSVPARTVSFAYDGAGDLVDATDVAGGVWHFTYDLDHRMVTMRDPRQSADPTPEDVTTHYDAEGRVDWQRDELGRTTSFDYSSIPGSTKITDPNGNVAVHKYQAGVLTEVTKGYSTAQAATWRYAYDPETLGVTSITDPNNHTTTKTYDDRGNELTSTDALNRTTTAVYNALDLPTSVTDPKNVTTTLAYDAAGNLLSTSTPLLEAVPVTNAVTTFHHDDPAHPGDVTSMTDPTNRTWSSTSDAEGDLTTTTDPVGHTRTFAHNAIGWVTSTVSPKGNAVGANPDDYRTSFEHNAFGEVTTTTDPLGHTTIRRYDPNGNVDRFTDGENRVTNFTFDDADQLITTIRPDTTTLRNEYWPDGSLKTQLDGANAATRYAYDPMGRLSSVTDPLARIMSYGYDPAGNLTTVIDPSTRVTTRVYDVADQLDAINYSDPATPDVTDLDYDPVGHRVAMTDGSGTSTWAWDSLGRLTASTDGAGSAVGYAYDVAGRLTTLTYPGNKAVTRGHDAAGRWTSVTDWLNNTTTFGYDDNDNLDTTTRPAASTNIDTAGFDRADRMTSTTMKRGAATLASLTYGRDNADLLTASTPTGLPQSNETYGYSSLSQVATVNGSSQFGYDPADNLTRINGVAGLAYDAANQLGSVPHGGAPRTFAYDSQGNRTSSMAAASRSFSYSYDQVNRLTSAATTNAVGRVDAGANHNLAAKTDGTLWAWGQGTSGKLGLNDTANRTTPTQVSSLSGVTTAAAGGTHSLAAKADGTVWGWGANASGQVGDGTTAQRNVPTRVPGLIGPTAIAAGGTHSLALLPNGTVWAWGFNSSGQLGDNSTTNRTTPTKVLNLSGVVAIAAGGNHSLALKSDGTVWAWGANASGQLGNNTTTMQKVPVQVSSLTGVTTIAAGATHSLAAKADGTAWGWGLNASGQVGNNSTTNRTTPAQVTGLTSVASLGAGDNHSLATKTDGTVWVWGSNSKGQLARATSTKTSKVPVQVTQVTAGSIVAGGAEHSLAIRTDGTGRSWGLGTSGQLGNGGTANATAPVTVTGLAAVAGGSLATYGYNGDGLRSSKTVLGATTPFTWDVSGGLPMLLLDGTSAVVYGPGGPVEQVSATNVVSYLHRDQLGSTRLVTDATGAATGSFSYDAYGTVAGATGTARPSLAFAGEFSDAETGFQYLRARYSDSASGQFLSRDPLSGATRQPYAYVGGNPLTSVDPAGLAPWDGLCFNNPLNRNDNCKSIADTNTVARNVRTGAAVVGGAALLVAGGAALAPVMAGSGAAAAGGGGAAATGVAQKVHGNSYASTASNYLYSLWDKSGNFLKWGISNSPNSRYPASYMKDKIMEFCATGSRIDMARLERLLTKSMPGPLNREPWAGKAPQDLFPF